MKPDGTWSTLGVSEDTIRVAADRLSERRELHQRVHRFFEQAGSLMLHSWYRYSFASIAFFHAVLGVEKALRLAYNDDGKDSFRMLFGRAVADGVVHDGIFAEKSSFRKEFKSRLPEGLMSYSARMAALVPKIRNEYFHGEYIMAEDFLPLSLRLREIADALATQKMPNKAPEPTPGAVTPRANSRASQ